MRGVFSSKNVVALAAATALAGAPACGDDNSERRADGAVLSACDNAGPGCRDGGDELPLVQERSFFAYEGPQGPVFADSRATLRRYEARVVADVEVKGLTAGHIYTMTWRFFNQPAACTDSSAEGIACGEGDLSDAAIEASEGARAYAIPSPSGGARADETGALTLINRSYTVRDRGGIVRSWSGGSPLTMPMTAEVHVVLRDHGPAATDAALENAQRSSYDGGCGAELFDCVDVAVAFFPSP